MIFTLHLIKSLRIFFKWKNMYIKLQQKRPPCISSGLDLNCVSNGKLLCFNTFEDILVNLFQEIHDERCEINDKKGR